MKVAYKKERNKLTDRKTLSQMSNKTNLQLLLEMFDNGVFNEQDLKGRGLLFSDIERIIKEAVKATQKEDLDKFNKKSDSLQKYTKDLKTQLQDKQKEIEKLNKYVDDLTIKINIKNNIFTESLNEYMNAFKELRSEIVSMVNEGRSISVEEINRLSKSLLDRPSIEDSKVFIDPTELREDLDPHIKIEVGESKARDVVGDLDKLRSLIKKKKKGE